MTISTGTGTLYTLPGFYSSDELNCNQDTSTLTGTNTGVSSLTSYASGTAMTTSTDMNGSESAACGYTFYVINTSTGATSLVLGI